MDLFARTRINSFSFSRIYPDGSRTELWSSAEALEHTFMKARHIVGAYTPVYYRTDERFALLSHRIDTYPRRHQDRYVCQLRDLRHYFDFAEPFALLNKTSEYTEFLLFYTPADFRDSLNAHINQLERLRLFADYFRKSAAGLIVKADADRLPPLKRQPTLAIGTELPPMLEGEYEPLTPRQTAIARQVASGRTAREIARVFGLSPRTVESHIEQIRFRLGCVNKAQLIARLMALGYLNGSG